MARRRYTIDAHRHTAGGGDFRADFGSRQNATVAGFGTLAELQFDHFDLFALRADRKFLRVEGAVVVAAAEIAGADLPDKVAAVFAMIKAIAALAGIVREAALFGAGIERANSIRTQGAETHRRYIQGRGRIGLCAIRSADPDAKRLLGR